MYCMCCKLRQNTTSQSLHSFESASDLPPLTISPIKQLNNNHLAELNSFKESTEELLLSLMQRDSAGTLIRGYLRDGKYIEDLEETNLSEQATQDERLYKLLFRRIYIENYTAQRLIREDIQLQDRIYDPESLQRMLIETIDKTAIIYRSILKEKINEICRGTSFEKEMIFLREINLRDAYHNFQSIIDIINTIIDYSRAIRTYSNQTDILLRYLETKQLIEPLYNINEEWLHRRCIQTVLQDTFIRSICSLARALLRTKTLIKHQDIQGIDTLSYLVDCCLNDQNCLNESRDLMLSCSSSVLNAEDEEDNIIIKELKRAIIPIHRLECEFTPQFLKSLERKIRKKK